MKHIHIVFPWLDVGCPNNGLYGIMSKICRILICSSFHLNIRIPSGFKTRMHSSKAARISVSHVGSKTPYFCANHDVQPKFLRCGGSNTTNRNDSSSKGISRKSPMMSGFTSMLRPSHAVNSSYRISINTASAHALSNHIMRDPQHASSIFLSVFIVSIYTRWIKATRPQGRNRRCR